MPVEEDGLDVGFTTYDYGCNVCPNKGWDGDKPIRYAIVQRGNLMCCERCGGCYGSVPAGVMGPDQPQQENPR
jgi:predicted SprT family Zn-dependent metalloprotease